jgi:eukaryotic-like serine/threonine-protein kinase
LKQQIDARADLFALGVTLYECATGANPFRQNARDILEVLQRIENQNLPRLQLQFQSGAEFADLLSALTQRQRVHRLRTAREAYEWIREICDREGVR